MRSKILIACLALFSSTALFGQLTAVNHKIIGPTSKGSKFKLQSRSATNPKKCGVDTVLFPRVSTYQYRSLLVGSGQSFGQFFGAPTEITVSGFRFFSYYIFDTVSKVKSTTVHCRLYKAGSDSLPTGSALASVSIKIDTIQGALYLNRITRDAVFSSPVKCNFPYIITVECDSTANTSKPGVVSNDWTVGDGEWRNLASASISGKWYNCLKLNIGGTTFDAHMQFYPFVKYDYFTDFTPNLTCYNTTDTLRFTNNSASNIAGSIFYNEYIYYNLESSCHSWVFNNNNYLFGSIDAKYKSSIKQNVKVELRSVMQTFTSATCYDTTIKTIYFKPGTPQLTKPANGCIGDSLRMNVSADAGTTINWYPYNGSNSFNVGSSYTIKNIQKPDTFTVKAINGTCISPALNIPIKASAYPTTLTTKNDSICATAQANLIANTNNGYIEWYTSKTGGTKLYTGSVYTTNSLSADTAFYAQATNNGCNYAGGRARVRAFVGSSFAPGKPTGIKDTSVCYGTSLTIGLTATPSSGSSLRWFDVATGSTPVGTGSTFNVTVNNRGTNTYYVESWNGICGSGRSPINVTGLKYPNTLTRLTASICSGDSAQVAASTLWGSVDWYSAKGGSVVSTGKFYTLLNPTQTGYAYYKTREDNCVSPNYDSVKYTVNTPPTVTSTTADAVCQKGLGSMSVNVPSGNVYWYSDATTATKYATGKTVDLGQIWSNVTLYYATESNGCYSARTPLTVKMLARPTAGFTWDLDWPRTIVCTPINSSGMTFSWAWGDGNSSTGLPASHQYATDGNYTITLVTKSTSNVCSDTADIPVVVSHVGTKNISNPQVSIYPNPSTVGKSLTINGIQVTEVHWFDLSGRFVATTRVENNQTIVPSSIKTGIYFIQGNSGTQSFKASIIVQ